MKRPNVTPILAVLVLLIVPLSGMTQEILFDRGVQAAGLKCFPIRGDEHSWYYLPDRPHVVVDGETGLPTFSFLMYVAPEQTESEGITHAPGGGILHFLVAYDVPEETVKDAQRELARLKPGAKLLGPVSYEDGVFALRTAMKDKQAGFIRTIVGVGGAPVMSGHKAAASMHLTQRGAALAWQEFHQTNPEISMAFEMTLSGYYNPVEATMTIDWDKVNQVIQAGAAGRVSFLAFEADALIQNMLNNGAITIELVGAPPELWNKVQKMGLELARNMLFQKSGVASLQELGSLGMSGPTLRDSDSAFGRDRRNSSLVPWSTPWGFPWAAGGTPPHGLRREACWRAPAVSLSEQSSVADAVSAGRSQCSQAERRAARDLFFQGVQAYRDGNFSEARRLWREGVALCDVSSFHWNLAVVALALDDHDSATYRREILNWASFIRPEAESPSLTRAINEVRSLPDNVRPPEDLQRRLTEQKERLPRAAFTSYLASSTVGQSPEMEASPTPEPTRPPIPTPGVTPPTQRTPGSRPRTSPHPTGTPAAVQTRSRTPQGHPARTPASRSPTPSRRSTATGRRTGSNNRSASGILVRFRLRRFRSTGTTVLSLKQWRRVRRIVRFSGDLGDLTGYLDNPKLFRRVNIDDPMFKQREIPVTVDVASDEVFGAMLNSVTVTLRKRHQGGRETLDEVTIRRADIAEGKVPKLLYGWDQDANRTRWLQYDYRVRWAYVGGPEIDTDWQTTSAGALVLQPPLRPRTLLLEADTEVLREAGVRHVTLDLHYDAAGIERRATATLKPSQLEGEKQLIMYQDPQHPEYQYILRWRFRGGRTVTSEPARSIEDILYLDEIPET